MGKLTQTEWFAPGSRLGPQGDIGDLAHHERRWNVGFLAHLLAEAESALGRGNPEEATLLMEEAEKIEAKLS